eukprot:1721776-Amphidinium_carterae.1
MGNFFCYGAMCDESTDKDNIINIIIAIVRERQKERTDDQWAGCHGQVRPGADRLQSANLSQPRMLRGLSELQFQHLSVWQSTKATLVKLQNRMAQKST